MSSYTPPDRSTYDPGWNDPPPMPSMTPQTTVAAGKPRISLNKRVAFPMQSSGTTSANVKTTAEGLPLPFSTAKYQPQPMPTVPIAEAPSIVLPPPIAPPPSSALNPQSNPIQPATTEAASEGFDSVTAKEFSYSIFARFVDGMTTDAGKLSEIRKRLEVLAQMWQENKLNAATQQILFQLAKALENKDAVGAMEQHRLLATQHTNVSTQWASALRQLILSMSPETELEPAVLSDTDVVQFVDVSTKPTVVDHIPIIPQEPINPLPESSNDNNSIPSENTLQSKCENAPKPKFGRILHL